MPRLVILGAAFAASLVLALVATPVEAQALAPTATADPPCYDNTTRFVNCGNGTVTDTVSGLIWLFDADCLSGDYASANGEAALLSDGQCGLTDNSLPGDWRLATRAEWEAILDPACAAPRIAGNGQTGSCYVDDPWASGVQSTYWSSSTDTTNTIGAWRASLTLGTAASASKAVNHFGWAVRKPR